MANNGDSITEAIYTAMTASSSQYVANDDIAAIGTTGDYTTTILTHSHTPTITFILLRY